MQFIQVLNTDKAFNYVVSCLDICSNLGKDNLYSTNWFSTNEKDALNANFDIQANLLNQISENTEKAANKNSIKTKLSRVNDLRPTFKYIENKDIIALDDVQLFEIKNFCLLCSEIAVLCEKFALKIEAFPNLEEVIALLDPNNERLPSFYIYDSYSLELKDLREQLKILLGKKQQEENSTETEEVLKLREACHNLEYKIRDNLTKKIAAFTSQLNKTTYLIGVWDVFIAKTELNIKWGLSRPNIGNTQKYTSLFNPMLRDNCELNSKRYQSVDVRLNRGICLLTGANMTGKTVLLKTLFLSQIMLQFGFFIPAQSSVMSMVDKVYLLSEDEQSELKGLSSFGSEMLNLNTILNAVEKGENIAVYIDELARTTNPDEGKAIVCAAIECLDKNNVIGIISTHYDNIFTAKRRLRIKGFMGGEPDGSININNIQDYIDYGVVELQEDEKVPVEALNIASILGVNTNFLTKANKILSLRVSVKPEGNEKK